MVLEKIGGIELGFPFSKFKKDEDLKRTQIFTCGADNVPAANSLHSGMSSKTLASDDRLVEDVMSRSGKVKKMFVRCRVNTLDTTLTVAIYKNNIATGFVQVVPAGNTALFEVTNEFSFVKGDLLHVQYAAGGGTGATSCTVTTEFEFD